MADETKDISKQEHLAIVLRYLDKQGTFNERFFTFVQATSLNAESLSNYLIKVLENNGLDLTYIVSQGYDGASVMSGHFTIVQQRCKENLLLAYTVIAVHTCLILYLLILQKRSN